MSSAPGFYGQISPGDTIVWARGGRYSCTILGRVESITTGGNFRIEVIRCDRPDERPGTKLVATANKSVPVELGGGPR